MKPPLPRRLFLPVAAAFLLSGCGQGEAPRDSWQPDRPVTIVVPWPAGGSTDQVTRLVAGLLAEELGQAVEVANEPGETGSVGTRLALEAEADGHTWSSGSSASLGVYPVLGLLETSLEDWHLFLTVANVPVVSVHAESPYRDSEVWVRQDAPPEVVATMERLWRERIAGSEELSRYARENGAVVTAYYGEEARRRTYESVKADAWALHELGRSAVSPETLGIARP